MAEYLIQDTTLTNIAAPIKTLMGLTDNLTPADMASNLNDANTAVANALVALAEKEVEVPDDTDVTDLAALIAAIEVGGISAWGTITPSSYTNSIATGVEIPNDNFYFAIVTISPPTQTGMNYIRCGYFVVQDSITSGLMLSAFNSVASIVDSPSAPNVNIVINRTDNTITFEKKIGSAPIYLEGGITFAWFIGGIA